MKQLKISVTEFAQKNLMTGDIDERSSIAQVSAELGSEIHREIQDRRLQEIPDYRREVSVDGFFPDTNGVAIELSGRIDGIWNENDGIVIEEIKSSMNVRRLLQAIKEDPEHPYTLQLKTYGWLTWRKEGLIPRLQLLLVAAGSRQEQVLEIDFDPEEFSKWIDQRQAWLSTVWQDVCQFKAERKIIAKSLRFPFARKRDGQSELIDDVADACKQKKQFIAQAPTGLGKTAAVMFPMLKSAIKRGDKLFYVTPKNSQLREAEKFLLSVKREALKPCGLVMTAKPKICMNTEVSCNPDACAFAKGHYDKVNANDLITRLRQEPIINADILKDFSARYEVCPYELSRQMMPWVDVVAGDYHYALSPRASLRDSARLPLVSDPKPVLAIDEAHNLAERALDWYSHRVELVPSEVIDSTPKKLRKVVSEINHRLTGVLSKTSPGAVTKFDRLGFIELVNKWTAQMPIVLEEASEQEGLRPVVEHWFSWLTLAELCQLPEELFFATSDSTGVALNLHCTNAGPLMREALSKFHAVVAFSATMKPFVFHQSMMGLNDERLITKEYLSPFPAHNRKIIAIPQVSTAWKDRPKSLPRIVEVIERVTALKKGNYVAFFPSFEMMRQATTRIKLEGFDMIEQPSSASSAWVQDALTRLRKKRNILLMAVQGGVMSEGVDLPGDQLIGAFIVGPAVSMITPEREERRKLLGALGGDGYAMAYGYPAMAKSIQSAGRVIRSPRDRGIIILMDPRFLQLPYRDALPSDWITEGDSPDSLVSRSILNDICDFWACE